MKTYLTALCACALCACSSISSSTIEGPLSAAPIVRPQNIERVNNGSIYQASMASTSLFSGERKPRFVGDTLKVNIAETLNASNTVNTDTSRDTKLAVKGPGAKAGLGIVSSIFNLDATASGSNSFKGDGTTQNSGQFTGQVAATVVNVLPNGNLVVAGDRSISLNGGVNVLRFSGIVNPKDIQGGNVVASSDAVNAKIEVVGRGEVSDASSRNWIQRVLADSLSFW
jgi:flagellar L-ring protein precursor FlgH